MEKKNDLAKKIGAKVKALRKHSGLTQRSLAESTSLSGGLLSKIENGLTMPSIPTLQIIASILKTDIGEFFLDEEEQGYTISCPGERRVVVSRSAPHGKIAYELELLAEGMKDPFMEPAIVSHVGKEREVEARTHNGQEFMYVLEGKVKMTLGSKEYILKKGHAAYWNGNVPHKGISLGNRAARAIHVHLIPGRWTGTFQHSDRRRQRSKTVKGKKG